LDSRRTSFVNSDNLPNWKRSVSLSRLLYIRSRRNYYETKINADVERYRNTPRRRYRPNSRAVFPIVSFRLFRFTENVFSTNGSGSNSSSSCRVLADRTRPLYVTAPSPSWNTCAIRVSPSFRPPRRVMDSLQVHHCKLRAFIGVNIQFRQKPTLSACCVIYIRTKPAQFTAKRLYAVVVIAKIICVLFRSANYYSCVRARCVYWVTLPPPHIHTRTHARTPPHYNTIRWKVQYVRNIIKTVFSLEDLARADAV